MIFVEKKFISSDDCEHLISLYRNNKNKIFQHRDTYPLNIEKLSDLKLFQIVKKMHDYAEKFCSKKLDVYAEIVEWPIDSFMAEHIDPDSDIFAGLVYLNEDYSGGHTCFDYEIIKPEIGKFVLFQNSILKHWVTKVEKSNRYTLAVWFT